MKTITNSHIQLKASTSMFMQVSAGQNTGQMKVFMRLVMHHHLMMWIQRANMIKVPLIQSQEQQQTMVFTEEVTSAQPSLKVQTAKNTKYPIGQMAIQLF